MQVVQFTKRKETYCKRTVIAKEFYDLGNEDFKCWSWEKGTLIFSVVVVKIKKPSDLCCKKLNLTVKYKKYCRNREESGRQVHQLFLYYHFGYWDLNKNNGSGNEENTKKYTKIISIRTIKWAGHRARSIQTWGSHPCIQTDLRLDIVNVFFVIHLGWQNATRCFFSATRLIINLVE